MKFALIAYAVLVAGAAWDSKRSIEQVNREAGSTGGPSFVDLFLQFAPRPKAALIQLRLLKP